ncbi:MAG: phospholipase D-like domain-containing protein [Aureispira sp.]
MFTNYNNVLVLQDKALAQAYTLEFNEMWGGGGAIFNATNAKAGAAKRDNTPHVFNVRGRVLELYFSPSDRVTSKITSSIYSADNDLEFCILSFTRNEIGTAVRNRHQAGLLEHGIMENINDNGSEYSYLTNSGVNLLADNQPTALHHKYAIIDAGDAASDPQVVTGSHNWTTAAESRNDENTLIIHDATITNLYLQEFALRWCQNKNNMGCALPFARFNSTTPLANSTTPLKLYPNPTSQLVTLELEEVQRGEQATVEIYSLTGQLLEQSFVNMQRETVTINVGYLPNGCYLLRLKDGERWYQEKLLIAQ